MAGWRFAPLVMGVVAFVLAACIALSAQGRPSLSPPSAPGKAEGRSPMTAPWPYGSLTRGAYCGGVTVDSGVGASVAGGSCGRVGGVAGTAAGASLLGGRVTSGGLTCVGAVGATPGLTLV